ncbi:MAG: DUF3574 domain-containing protein [Gammaproteobacteria bacterium]
MTRRAGGWLVLTANVLCGCATPLAPPAACAPGAAPYVRETLYFGLGRPDGSRVSAADWRAFVADSILPRFPDGFTVSDAAGQWRGDAGPVAESTKVLVVLHRGASTSRVREIAAEYRQRFRQEAVLRETSSACVEF